MFLFRYIIQIKERFYLTSLIFLALLNAAKCGYELEILIQGKWNEQVWKR
jgi:hypothetical protein